MIPVDVPLKDREVKKIFDKIKVPHNPKLNSISISYDVFYTLTNENTVRTWYIYPKVFPVGSLNDSLRDVKAIYNELTMEEIMIRATNAKLKEQ